MTKYFLDTEFIEDGKTIDLISIGLVCEDGRTFYKQNVECQFGRASDWVWRNVFPHLLHFDMRGRRACVSRIETYDSGLGRRTFTTCTNNPDNPCPWATRREIRDRVLDFCSIEKHDKPEFWGYFADYDWVAFCQLFGTMIELPKGFPMYCRDIKQWADQLGDILIPEPEVEVHQALADALWIKEAYEFLVNQNSIKSVGSHCKQCHGAYSPIFLRRGLCFNCTLAELDRIRAAQEGQHLPPRSGLQSL